MLVFDPEERGKPEYPEKNLSEQGREPITNGNYEKCKITVHSVGNHTYRAFVIFCYNFIFVVYEIQPDS